MKNSLILLLADGLSQLSVLFKSAILAGAFNAVLASRMYVIKEKLPDMQILGICGEKTGNNIAGMILSKNCMDIMQFLIKSNQYFVKSNGWHAKLKQYFTHHRIH